MTELKDDLAALRIDREFDDRPRRRWTRWLAVFVLVTAGAAALTAWLGRDRPVNVQVAAVSLRGAGVQAAVLNASGYVTARRRATVSSKVTGKVIEVNVEEGMDVQPGRVRLPRDPRSPPAGAWALLMGLFGGLLPAFRASRLPIATALHEL